MGTHTIDARNSRMKQEAAVDLITHSLLGKFAKSASPVGLLSQE